jgi:hypothetical protein
VTLLLFGFLLFRILPQPTEPIYARLAPSELKPEKIFKVHPIKGNKGKPDKPGKPPKKPKQPKPRIRSPRQTVHKFDKDHWLNRLG